MPTQANQPLGEGYQLQKVLRGERDSVVSKAQGAADLRGGILKLAGWRPGR